MVKRLLLLNGLAILAVILYHSSAWGFISLFWWTDRYSPVTVPNFDLLKSPTYFALRMVEQYVIFAIPAFLFISGYFVSVATERGKSTLGWNVVLSRTRVLLIPFLVWSIIILVSKIVQGQMYTLEASIVLVLTGRVAPPFYYVLVLAQLYLLSPFLVPLALTRWKLLAVITGCIQLFVLILRYPQIIGMSIPFVEPFYVLTTGWLFPGYIFWFSAGMIAGLHLIEFKHTLARLRWGFLFSTLIFFGAGMFEWETLLRLSGQEWIAPTETLTDQFFAGAFILSFLSFVSFTPPFPDLLANLGGKSFGIYLIHTPVIELTARVIYHVSPGLLAYQVLFQPILWCVGLSVPLVMMLIVNQSSGRRGYSYLFG